MFNEDYDSFCEITLRFLKAKQARQYEREVNRLASLKDEQSEQYNSAVEVLRNGNNI